MGVLVHPYHFNQMNRVSEFQRALLQSGLRLPVSEDLSILARSVELGRGRAPNAIVVQPLEGADCTDDGAPTQRTRARYEGFARGGAGVIWFEACAVSRDGRDNPHQMYLHSGTVKAMAQLVRGVDRAAGERWGHVPYKVLQLTHSGRAAVDAGGAPAPQAAFYNPYLDGAGRQAAIVSDERLARLEEELTQAAVLAAEAGFDAVDLKLCHNYLTRELLAAYTRAGPYGGSYENRTRLIRNVIANIRARLGQGLDLAVRLNAYDAIPYPYGWGMAAEPGVMKPDLSEPRRLVARLARLGVCLFNITSMMPRCIPWGRGYLAVVEKDAPIFPYAGVETLLRATRELKYAAPQAKTVATGLSWFQQFGANVAAGGLWGGWFDLAGFGRQALADPDFAADLLEKGKLDPGRVCRFCDSCYRQLEQGAPVGCTLGTKRDTPR